MKTAAGSFSLFLACLTAAAALLAGCRKTEVYNAAAHRYICIVPPEERYYWGEIKDGIRKADRVYGCYTKIETYERFDLTVQKRLLEQTEAFHTDGIITVGEPQDSSVTSVLKTVIGRKVPVILLDTDSDEDSRTAYIGSDNRKVGQQAADSILAHVSGHVRAVITVTELDSANQRERADGFRAALERSGRGDVLCVLRGEDNASSLQEQLENLFAAGKDLSPNAVFCAEASTTQKTGLFLQDRGLCSSVTAIGFDLVGRTQTLVEEGVLSGTILQEPETIGYKAVSMLEDLCDGKDVPSSVYTKTSVWSAGEDKPETEKEQTDQKRNLLERNDL